MTSATLRSQLEISLAKRIPAAFSRKVVAAPELLPSGIPTIDEMLGGGIPRGGFTEITGPHSSGRTALGLSVVARATQNNSCAWIDVYDALDPESAVSCGVHLQRLLWLRMGGKQVTSRKRWARKDDKPWTRLDQALKATDLLLQAGGFCVVVLDMSDVRPDDALRVPLASWYRFRLAAAQARTALILLAQVGCAKSSASLALRCEPYRLSAWNNADEVALFQNAECGVTVERKRGEEISVTRKKISQSSHSTWNAATLWTQGETFWAR